MTTEVPHSAVLDHVLLPGATMRQLQVSYSALEFFEFKGLLHPVRIKSGNRTIRLFLEEEVAALAAARSAMRKARERRAP